MYGLITVIQLPTNRTSTNTCVSTFTWYWTFSSCRATNYLGYFPLLVILVGGRQRAEDRRQKEENSINSCAAGVTEHLHHNLVWKLALSRCHKLHDDRHLGFKPFCLKVRNHPSSRKSDKSLNLSLRSNNSSLYKRSMVFLPEWKARLLGWDGDVIGEI